MQYSEDTMEEAVMKVKQMHADMGGTEILQPLQHIYKQPCIPSHPRQVILFFIQTCSDLLAATDLYF